MPESPADTIRRAVEALRVEAKRYQPGGRDEAFRLAVAAWLDSWHPFGLTDEFVADGWREEWGHAKAVAEAALGEARDG